MDYRKLLEDLVGETTDFNDKFLHIQTHNEGDYYSDKIRRVIILNIKNKVNITTWIIGNEIYGNVKKMSYCRSFRCSLSSFKRLEIAESILEEL